MTVLLVFEQSRESIKYATNKYVEWYSAIKQYLMIGIKISYINVEQVSWWLNSLAICTSSGIF